MPWITADEAEMIRRLPAVRDVNVGEYTNGPVSYGGREPRQRERRGLQPQLDPVNGGDILAGRNFTPIEYAAGAHVAIINDKLAESLFPGPRSDRQAHQDLRRAVRTSSGCTRRPPRSSATPTSRGSPFRTRPSPRWPTTGGAGWKSRSFPPSGATMVEAQDQVTAAHAGARAASGRRRRTTSRS